MNETVTQERQISIHKIVASSGADSKGLDILHKDLFDSRPEVVVSALRTIARIADASSARYVARLISSSDHTIKLEAIRCIGILKLPAVIKLLNDLYKTNRDEDIRCEALKALANAAPSNPDIIATIHEQATSHLSSAELRAAAAVLLVRTAGAEKIAEVLTGASPEVVERVLANARETPELTRTIVKHAPDWYDRFVPASRKLLVAIAAESEEPEAVAVVLRGIDDDHAEVRHSAYRALGRANTHADHLPAAVERLFDRTEPAHSLEEEAIAAIDRLETLCQTQSTSITTSTLSRLRTRSTELFRALSAPENRTGSDTIELGWLILHSRDYMEYYASQEFRQALVHYLKGGSYHTMDQMLSMLKRSAERVEVRHFDGYRALGEIIKNPKRPGTALITRELSTAKLGKREPFGRLIRNLRLMRLVASGGSETVDLAARIFMWAKGEKLFRLAEAALYCLAKYAPDQAITLCRGLLSPPIESKILSIAAIRLAPSLGGESFVNEADRLLRNSTDSHILLNLLDAIPAMGLSENPQIVKAALGLLRNGEDSEVVRQDARFLASSDVPNLFESVTAGYARLDEWRQKIILQALDRIIEEKRTTNREGLAEFLYQTLRNQKSNLRGTAAVLLWKLGDDFALKVLDRLLRNGDIEQRIDVIHGLKGYINKPLAASLLSLLDVEHVGLQEALRETLEAVVDESAIEYVRQQVTGSGSASDGEESASSPSDDAVIDTGIVTEKEAFRFEHEFTDELAVFFTDIQGYSRKAQLLTTMQLTSLIHDYEGILLPTVAAHRGALIKKMGDGHLFIFESAIDAGLAALRLQKALKRFNGYREENFRVIVRVGIHWGQVVRRDGDVLGNHVNIASRLESAAKGGSVLVSEALYNRFGGRIHARELGKITVKNIIEPIKVFEPYEIQIDLPEKLDPLKTKSKRLSTSREQRTVAEVTSAATEDTERHVVNDLSTLFQRFDELCVKIEQREIPVSLLRTELRKGRVLAQRLLEKHNDGY